MAASYYYTLNFWKDATKSGGALNPAPIHRVRAAQGNLVLNGIDTYQLDLHLGDKVAGILNASTNSSRGAYWELQLGWTSPVTFCAGYVQQMDKSDSKAGDYSVKSSGPLLTLQGFNNGGDLEMTYPAFQSVMDFLNGVNPAGQPARPGQYGLLSGSGWIAVWVGGGTPPGLGDSFRTDFDNAYDNVLRLAQHYSIYFRVRPGSTATNGVIEIGPLHDACGITAFGGEPLLQQQQGQYPYLAHADLDLARKAGFHTIEGVSKSEDMANVHNCIWGIGAGAYDTLVTFRSIYGDVFQKDGKTLAPGVSVWYPRGPQGRPYYLKTNNRQTWQGHTFALIAHQEQDGGFNYGAVDQTSVAKYGLWEYPHVDKQAHDPSQLFSTTLGYLESNTDPVSSWTFTVRAPMIDANRVPPVVLPGQQIGIQYKGVVHDYMEWDATKYQWYGAGPYTYLDYPGTTDPAQITKLQHIVSVNWQLSANTYTYTLELGKGKRNKRSADLALARDFQRQRHQKQHKPAAKRGNFEHVAWIIQGKGSVGADHIWMTLYPGDIAVTDVPNDRFFGDHTVWDSTFQFQDNKQYIDFLFHKPTSMNTLTSINTSPDWYYFFRMATPGSGKQSGFYQTRDGTPATTQLVGHRIDIRGFTQKGHTYNAGPYALRLKWSGGVYEAHLSAWDGGPYNLAHHTVARWRDRNNGVQTTGAIGFHVVGGTQVVQFRDVHAARHKKAKRATTGGRGNRHTVIADASNSAPGQNSGGLEVMQHDSEAGTVKQTHHLQASGKAMHTDQMRHSLPPNRTTCSGTVTLSGGVYTVPIAPGDASAPVAAGGLHPGWKVYIGSDSAAWVTVESVNFDNAAGAITGVPNGAVSFTTTDAQAATIAPNTSLWWDPGTEDNLQTGHVITHAYHQWQDKKGVRHAAWCQVHHAAGSDPAHGTMLSPDGQLWVAGRGVFDVDVSQSQGSGAGSGAGSGTTASGNGAGSLSGGVAGGTGGILAVAEYVLDGQTMAEGLAQSGQTLFDANEFNSTTQHATEYNMASNPAGTTVGPSAMYHVNPSTGNFAVWAAATNDAMKGSSTAILGLTTNPSPSGIGYTRWWDTAPVDGTGAAKAITIKNDIDISLLAYLCPNISGQNVTVGNACSVQYEAASGQPTIRINEEPGPAGAGMAANQQWVVNPGQYNMETMTVQTFGSQPNHVTWTANLLYYHEPGEPMVQYTDASGNVVQPPAPFYTDTRTDSFVASIDAISMALGDANGNMWTVYWGDPTFDPPWRANVSSPSCTLSQASNQWDTTLHVNAVPAGWGKNKIVQLGSSGSTVEQVVIDHVDAVNNLLYLLRPAQFGHTINTNVYGDLPFVHAGKLSAANVNQWRPLSIKPSKLGLLGPWMPFTPVITQVEVSVMSRAGAPVTTCYFDLFRYGFIDTTNALPNGAVNGGAIAPGSVGNLQVNIDQAPWLVTADGLRFWCDGTHIYWTGGTILSHDAGITASFAIHGAADLQHANIGITTDVPGQANLIGDYLVFNATGITLNIWDPGANGGTGGTVTIAPYGATGGAGGQSSGFGTLSASFNWTTGAGGAYMQGGLAYGAPNGLIKLGKVETTASAGLYPIDIIGSGSIVHQNEIANGAVGSNAIANGGVQNVNLGVNVVAAGNIQNGAVSNLQMYPADQSRGHFPGVQLTMGADGSGNPILVCGALGGVGSPTFVRDDGTGTFLLPTGTVIAANQWPTLNNPANSCILFRVPQSGETVTAASFQAVGTTLDLTNPANTVNGLSVNRYMKLGYVSPNKEPVQNNWMVYWYVDGIGQVYGSSLYNYSVGYYTVKNGIVYMPILKSTGGTPGSPVSDTWVGTSTTYVTGRGWRGTGPTMDGRVTSGNMTGFTSFGLDETLQVAVMGTSGAWSAWTRLYVYSRVIFVTQPASAIPSQYAYTSPDSTMTVCATTFDVLTDGTCQANFVYFYSGASNSTIGIQVRSVFAVAPS